MSMYADIVIVGSGACGAAAAWSLSKDTKLRIVCIEQGKEEKPTDYPATKIDWERKKSTSYSMDPNVRKNQADYPVDNKNSPISLANFNGFGGSTILYSGHFPRFHPSDFRTKSLDSFGEDWPIQYDELIPYFQQNEDMMGVAGILGDPANPNYQRLLPPVSLGEGGKRIAQAFDALQWHWWPSYSAINTTNHQGRSECNNLGPCNTGCPQGAKGSVDVTYWPMAKLQGVEILTECAVFNISIGDDGKATGVEYFDANKKRQYLRARLVILACSGAGTPRLLLQSRSKRYPKGLLNNNDLVGRNLMLHPLAYIEGVFEDSLETSIGPQGCSLFSQEFYETRQEHDFSRGYTMHVLRGSPPLETATRNYLTRRLPLGKKHHKTFDRVFNHNMGVVIISDDLAEFHNRIELDPEQTDQWGLPGIKVNYQIHDNTKKILKHGIKKAKQMFEQAGATVTSAFAPVSYAGWHIMGTAKMGNDPKTSVVNRFGQSHEVKNLFIVDSSIFVTAGAVNPVATAQALTLKICDDIKTHFDEWANEC